MIHSLLQDLRYGARQLFKDPAFTLVAAVSLALGIGANTAIFQLVNAIRLKTLPVKDPQELVSINFAKNSSLGGWWSSRSARMTSLQFDQIRQNQQGFTGVIGWSAARFNMARGGEPDFAEGLYVSGDFFPQLGVNAVLGRTFNAQDDNVASCTAGAVLSYAFWQGRFGADRAVLGKTIDLEKHPVPIIGVTGPSFFGVEVGNRFDVAIPLCADRLMADDNKGRIPVPHAYWLSAIGRLKPGWTTERATAQLQAVSPIIMKASLPPIYKPAQVKRYLNNKLEATPAGIGVSGLRQQYERTLWVLMATTGLVLLIACANLANLLLARASVRQGEIAIRLAIGASRGRLVRQLLVESLLLAALGTALGVGLAQLLSRGLVNYMNTSNNPIFVGIGMDWHLFGFTAAIAVITCVLFGLAPALNATGLSPVAAIRAGGRSLTANRERFSLRRLLMVVQVAFSLVLLVGALLFVQSLHNLMTTNAGFHAEGVMSAEIGYTEMPKARRQSLPRELLDRLSTRVGVVSAAQVGWTPVSGSGWNNDIGPDATTAAASGKNAFFNRAGPGYFRTMGTRVLAGREFTEADTSSSPKVAIVNQEFARKYFSGKNPVGHTFHLEAEAGKPEPLIQIVGLVENTKYYELNEDFKPIGFFPVTQDDDPGPGATFVLRVSGSPGSVINAVKSSVAEISPAISFQFRSFSQQLDDSLLRERLMATLSGAFGILAVVLATVGLYGVISYLVTRRRNEIGIRIALGADRGRVILLVLREAALLLTAGVVVGALFSIWVGRTAATLLYGLKPYDPVSLVGASLLLAAIALTASYVPANRAARLEPMVALRDE
jgi:putative ABC transport system permease protein